MRLRGVHRFSEVTPRSPEKPRAADIPRTSRELAGSSAQLRAIFSSSVLGSEGNSVDLPTRPRSKHLFSELP